MSVELEASFAHCAAVARRSGSNFYISFLLLPKRERQAMVALYAFLRQTDDLADGDQPTVVRRAALDAWREELKSALAGDPTGLVFPALVDTVKRYEIPPENLFDVLDGVEMDLEPLRFATMAELEPYCHRVASAVGHACLCIWGYHGGKEALRMATTCGVAFQMTNILRDVKEDALCGRVYLPTDDLQRFDCTEADLQGGEYHDRLRALMQFEIARVEQLYQEVAGLRAFLSPRGRRVFGAMVTVYQYLFQEIRRREGNVFGARIRVPLWRRLAVVARYALLPDSPERPRAVSGDVSSEGQGSTRNKN